MRHRHSGRKFNRTAAHRKALMKSLAVALIEREGIKTVLPKAKELRRFAEPLVTLAKQDSVANRRLAFARLRSRDAVGKLFGELGPRFKERPGGYTRIVKMGFRPGDKAPMAYVEWVDRASAEGVDEAVTPPAGESLVVTGDTEDRLDENKKQRGAKSAKATE